MDGVRKSVTSGILLGAGITVILTAVSVPLARPVLELMQTPEDILDDAHAYIAVIFAGIGASVMFNLLSNIIRALGDSRTPCCFWPPPVCSISVWISCSSCGVRWGWPAQP